MYRMMTLESARNGLTFSLLSSKVVSAVVGKGLSLSELTPITDGIGKDNA